MADKYFKVSYNQSVKKLKIAQITTYSLLVQKIKSLFKVFKDIDVFCIYYYDEDGQRYEIQGQDQFQIYLDEEIKHKIFIKKQQDEYQSFQNLDNSTILNGSLNSKQQNSSIITANNTQQIIQMKLKGTKQLNTKSQIKPISKISQMPIKKQQTSNIKPSNTDKMIISKIQQAQQITQPIIIDNQQKKVQIKSQIKAKKETSQTKLSTQLKTTQSAVQNKGIKKQIVEKKPAVHKISCNGCKSTTIVGIRYRSLISIDVDYCDTCYKAKKLNESQYLKMDSQDFIKNINFKTSMYKLFDQNYKPQPSKNRQISAWISQDDIIQQKPNIINEIWKASDKLSKNILSQFQQWNQKWQIQHTK